MKIYNSLTNKLEEFIPINKNEITMYVCGPTVNKRTHIGHLYPSIFFDVVYRYFKYKGYRVKYASNFTDVDDKIIKSALEENKKEKEIAKKYEDLYLSDLKKINCLPVDYRPRVTEYMPDIIEFISSLLDIGCAYKKGEDIYLNINKLKNYGILSNQNIDDLDYGNRIKVDSNKENPYDFVLWKNTKEGIKWAAPFGEGRPGWHTECVVMINKIFGNKIDIHGGGIDLKFPHHENEIAQSMAIHNNCLANYWMHNGHLMINGSKMSKSLGNIIILDDLLNKYTANTVRIAILKNNYKQPLLMSDELFNEAKTIDEKTLNIIKLLNIYISTNNIELGEIKNDLKIEEIMNNDFNTSNLITYLLDIIKNLNLDIRNKSKNIFLSYNSLQNIINVLGLTYDIKKLSQEDLKLYNRWNEYREQKDFEKADKLRKDLLERGIV